MGNKKQDKQLEKLLFEVYDKGVKQQDCNLTEYIEKVKQALRIHDVSGLLFLELAIRCQRELPLHEDELRWWNEETNVFQCGDFTSRFEDEIARVRKNNNR